MTIKYPKTIGACIDQLYEARQARLDLQRQLESLKQAEEQLAAHIIETFSKADIGGAKGMMATAAITRRTTYRLNAEPSAWEDFMAYVAANKAWDLVQKRCAVTAVGLRFQNGENVPGLEAYTDISLSLTKAGG